MGFEEILVDQRVVERRQLCAGWGVNDAPYITQPTVNGKVVKCPYYAVWSRMVHAARAWRGTVCKEWRYFMAFRAWMSAQDWGGKRFDRDLLVAGNAVFCPERCCFVTHNVAGIRRSLGATGGPWPPGVDSPSEGRYRAVCGKHLGYFHTPEAAHEAWRTAKKCAVYGLATEQTDDRVRDALIEIANGI